MTPKHKKTVLNFLLFHDLWGLVIMADYHTGEGVGECGRGCKQGGRGREGWMWS